MGGTRDAARAIAVDGGCGPTWMDVDHTLAQHCVMNLNQVTLPSRDVARAAKFYAELGLRMIVDSRPRYVRFECPQGGATFSLHHVDELPASSNGMVVYFECDDLDAKVQALQARGVHFETPPTDQPWLWREARLRDPDGQVICLYHAGINRRQPPWRVNRG